MPGANVRLANGQTIRVEGNTREEIMSKVEQLENPGADLLGPGLTAFTGGVTERVIDNVLGVPEMFARAGREAAGLGDALLGNRPLPSLRGGPETSESVLGLPSGRQVVAGASSLLGGDLEANLAQREQIAQNNPGADFLGRTAGDAAFLATPRGAVKASTGRAGGLFDDSIQQLISSTRNRLPSPTAVGTKAAISRTLGNETVQELFRAAGRSVETGLEGALLASVQDGDPVQAAALSAGAQLAGSAALGVTAGTASLPTDVWPGLLAGQKLNLPRKVVGLAVQAGLLGGIFQLGQQFFPDDNSQVVADEQAFSKTALTLMVGALAATTAKRTKPDGILANYPVIADAITTLGRGSAVSILEDMSSDANVRQLLNVMSKNPQVFSEKMQSEINAIINDPEKSLSDWIESQADDERLSEILSAPDPRLIGVPLKEE